MQDYSIFRIRASSIAAIKKNAAHYNYFPYYQAFYLFYKQESVKIMYFQKVSYKH